MALKDHLGKVTLLDFWASWCPPCRKANPEIVKLYQKYHSQGLNIISISMDDDRAKWEQAIAKDGLTWPQISNLKEMEDPIAKLYGISLLPTTFLLDKKGKIIGIDLPHDAMEAKIKELLKAK
ncbi:TlpA family protein disulfide reductase [Flavobacterium sp.]|uniref:TlpA family protein disulfide reductase n=1 Tax=Flavobacterium sp. TaxID=239 RepID=UPI002FDE7EA6